MTTSPPSSVPARASFRGHLEGFGTRMVHTYLALAIPVVGVVGLGVLVGLSVATAMGGVDGLPALFLLVGVSFVGALVLLPVLTMRFGLGWGSVVGLLAVLALELVQSMTIGELSWAIGVALVGPGVVALVVDRVPDFPLRRGET